MASSLTKLPFFASKVRLGRAGVEQVVGFPWSMTAAEKAGSLHRYIVYRYTRIASSFAREGVVISKHLV